MFYHYFKTAWRSLWRSKSYTLLHLLGLTTGIAACLLITSYVWNEYNYERFHEKGDRIVRLNTELIQPNQRLPLALAAGPAAPALMEDFPVVESFARLAVPWSKLLVRRDDFRQYETDILYADSTFFDLFDFPLLAGSSVDALAGPNRVVLSERKAQVYFGRRDPIGAQLMIDGVPFEVTGVVKNPARNSHLQFDFLLSFASWIAKYPTTPTNWTWTNFPTYLLLSEPEAAGPLEVQLEGFLKRRAPEEQSGFRQVLSLEPLHAIHFGAARLGDLQPRGNRNALWFLSLAALFILTLAIANYVNLSTALYIGRVREIGVRKTVGASRSQVAGQFMAEGLMLCSAAVSLATVVAAVLLPAFGNWLDRDLSLMAAGTPDVVLFLLVITLVVGFAAAFYPSQMASRLRPVHLFQKREMKSLDKGSFRRGLTTLQFVISIGLLLGTVVLWRQLNFLNQKDLGFAKTGKVVLEFGNTNALEHSFLTVKENLMKVPGVTGITFSSHVPGETPHGLATQITQRNGRELSAEMGLFLVDFDFLNEYQIPLIAGRAFNPAITQDTAGALILNRSAMELLGFSSPEEVLGLEFAQWGRQGRVIGVVEDFIFESMHQNVGPASFQINTALFEKATIQLESNDLPGTISRLEGKWKALAGHLPFEYYFLEDYLAGQYAEDARQAQLVSLFTGLAILLACLGLIGLIAFTCRQQAKAIAIRKVFGASVADILWLLNRGFLHPVLIGWILALPITYWILQRWLNTFAYRIELAWWPPLLVGLGMGLLVAIVVSWQSYATASANPVRYLKEE
jgi:putative ABC transport system permease protein